MKYLVSALILLFGFSSMASAENLKFTVGQQVNTNGSVTPTLTWCTEQVTSPGLTCAGSAPASACTASGDWSGSKAASGSETLAAVSTTKTYSLQCSWPGSDQFTVKWTPPTTNSDGSPLTDLKGFHVYYSTSSSMSQNQLKDVQNPAAGSVIIGPGLAPATYYVVVSAYNVPGAESTKVPSPPLSRAVSSGAVVGQTVKVTFPAAPTNLTVE